MPCWRVYVQVGERRYAPVIGAATRDEAGTRGLAVVAEYGLPAPRTKLQLMLGRATPPRAELVRVDLLHEDHRGLHVPTSGPYDPSSD